MKPEPLTARSVGETEDVSRPCLSISCCGVERTPPGAYAVDVAELVTRVEKRAVVSLYPTVFTFVMLSDNMPIAWAWADKPDTPENRAP